MDGCHLTADSYADIYSSYNVGVRLKWREINKNIRCSVGLGKEIASRWNSMRSLNHLGKFILFTFAILTIFIDFDNLKVKMNDQTIDWNKIINKSFINEQYPYIY